MVEEETSRRRNGLWGFIAFGVTLAVIIGIRLDQAALAVVVGVACGVMAGIPTSFIIVSLLRRREEEKRKKHQRRGTYQSPPVVVVAPPAAPQLRQSAAWTEDFFPPLPAQRQFSVIGEEEIEDLD